MNRKRALLIAGGGTLGSYATLELLKKGWAVDVILLEKRVSLSPSLRYITSRVDDGLLRKLFGENRYDTVIDFIHYPDPSAYRQRADLLLQNTDQLIFLSSYRVYANEETPVRETSPLLLDVVTDRDFLENETYAVPKTKNERYLRSTGKKNFTIVRPLISFSHYRLDLICTGAPLLLRRQAEGKPVLLPAEARYLAAGVGWAGNVGKMFAGLAGNEKALGETFTLGTDENPTWDEVAGYYREIMGIDAVWVETEAYRKTLTDRFYLTYDRLFDRRIDNSRIREVTGLAREDFTGVREGILREVTYLGEHPEELRKFDTPAAREASLFSDAYLAGKEI